MPVWLIVLRVIVLIVGLLGVLAYVGVRRFIVEAKTAEAVRGVNPLAIDAERAYEGDGKLRDSASSPVTASISSVSGKRFSSGFDDALTRKNPGE